jgi:hypothetical protein
MNAFEMTRPDHHASAVSRHRSMLRFRQFCNRLSIIACASAVIAMTVVICRTSHLLG